MFKTKTWIIAIVLLLVLSAGAALLLFAGRTPGTTAQILWDGKVVKEINLSTVTLEYSFTLEDEHGSNTVTVSHGRIAITAADCPDQICVKQGAISTDGDPIVCLPHKLMVRIISGDRGDYDILAQ